MKVVLDIETNNLLGPKLKHLWIVCFKDIATNKMYTYGPGDTSFLDIMDDITTIIGHNIMRFDMKALEVLTGWKPAPHVNLIDTLILSQILDWRRFGNDGHALKRWGEHFGYPKGDYDDFEVFSAEMIPYCQRDVDLNHKVYDQLLGELKVIAARRPIIRQYIKAEHCVAEWCTEAYYNGWPFDMEAALKLQTVLIGEMDKAYVALECKLGQKCVAKDKVKGEYFTKMPKWTKNGNYDSHTARWFDIPAEIGQDNPEWRDQPFFRMIRGEYSRIEIKPLSLNSVQDVKIFLDRNGWIPDEWNYKRIESEDGGRAEMRRMAPKITESSLEFLGGDGVLYREFLTQRARYAILKTWIANTDENNMLHGDCFCIGTPSMRTRHSIIANIPSGGSAYGEEMRRLFTVNKGWKFIGADSSGNQARGLAHYLKNDEFTDILLNGDIHNYNARAATEVLKSMKIDHVVPRATAKRILYAFLFGASGGKLWSYIFGVNNGQKGNKFKKGFLKAVPGFADLIDKLESKFRETKKGRYGYIRSLVGNRIYVDSPHKLLVYLLQCTEKITCSAACMLTMEGLAKENIPYKPLIMYHDEIDFMTPAKYAVRAGEIASAAFKDGPALFGVDIMDGEAEIGMDWYECH